LPWYGWGYSPYYYPYGYYPAPVDGYAPSYPPYPSDSGAPPPAGSWYHCEDPQGYYPYVQSCNHPWQSVPATPQQSTTPLPATGPGFTALNTRTPASHITALR
jgi:hypothetical protein